MDPDLDPDASIPPAKLRKAGARTVIIGDVHGCLDELQELLRACSITWGNDLVVMVGDLVAKGPDSQGVVQLARERSIKAVLGNHDAKVLTHAPGPGEVAASLPPPSSPKASAAHQKVARTLAAADWSYLQGLPLYLPLPGLQTVVVHAGMVAGLPLDQQPRDLIMNMRSITPDGQPSKRVEAGVPWASLWRGPTHVVFGHDAVRGLQQHPFATGLDTGCVYGRSLTALILPERRMISVAAHRVYTEHTDR